MMSRVLGALACLVICSEARATPGAAELLVHLNLPLGAARATVSLRARDAAWRVSVAGREDIRLADVPSGAYELRVEASGVEPAVLELSLAVGEILRLESRLLPAGGGRSSLVVAERFRPSLGATFDDQRLGELPSSRTIWSVLETADATAVMDRIEGAGLYAGEPGLVGIHGSSWTQTGYRLGGLDVTDPGRTGTPLVQAEFLALAALDVISGLAPVEIGPPGATLVMAPRRPAASWQGTALVELAPARGGQPEAPPAIARSDGGEDGALRLEGPLSRERLALGLAGTFARSRRFERDASQPLDGRVASLLTRLVWTASSRDEVDLLGTLQQTKAPGARRNSNSLQATWRRRSDTLIAFTAGITRASDDPAGPFSADPRVVERLREGPVERLFPGRTTRTVGQLELHAAPQPFRLLRVPHALRLGGALSRKAEDARPAETRRLTAETVNGLAARVWDYGWPGPEARWRATEAAAWAADRVRIGGLDLEAGVRLDLSRGSRIDSAAIDWTSVSPRVAARFALPGDRLSVLAGWGRYAHRLPLGLLAFGDAAAPHGVVYRWDDRNRDVRFDPSEIGPLVARVGPGSSIATVDPRLARPRTDEAVAGLEARIAGQWHARLLGVRRRERRLVASVNVGLGPADHEVVRVFDPGGDLLGAGDDQLLPIYDRRPESFGRDRFLLTNPTGENSLHEGVELELDGAIGRRLWLRLGATASRTNGPGANRGFRVTENDQGLVGERREAPNAETNSRGRLFFDRAYTIKVAAGWRAPADVRLAAVARYQDGQPFSRLVLAPGLRQGPDFVQAIKNGRSRFAYTMTIDFRVEKGFAVGRRRLAASASAFNLLDSAREVEEDVTTGSSFRTVTAVQPPRAVRLGLRLDF